MANPGQGPRWRFMSATKATLLGLLPLGVTLLTGALHLGTYGGFTGRGFEETIPSWGAWGVFGSIGLLPLGHRLRIEIVALAQFFDRSLRSLYCRSDGVRRLGPAV